MKIDKEELKIVLISATLIIGFCVAIALGVSLMRNQLMKSDIKKYPDGPVAIMEKSGYALIENEHYPVYYDKINDRYYIRSSQGISILEVKINELQQETQ